MVQLIDKTLHNPNALQNLGIFDRVARVVIGLGMIGVWFFYPIQSVSMWLALVPLIGIYPLLSGILGWCPVYAMLHKKTCGTDAKHTCGTFPDQLDHLIHPHQQ